MRRGQAAPELQRLSAALEEAGVVVHAHRTVVKYHAKYLVADGGPAVVVVQLHP
jgi:hypothetical protein